MPWSTLASNQTVTCNNLQNAVNTGVFTLKNSIPATNECITKENANYYVNINTSVASYASKASNQLVYKADLVAPSSGVVFNATSGLYPVSGGSSTCVGTLTNYGPSLVAIKGLFNSAGISSGTVGNNRVYYRAYSGGPTIYVYFLNQTITSFGQNILTNRDSDNIRPGWFYLPVGATYDITIDKFDGAGSGSTFRLAQSSTPDGTYTAI
jgi:hypothetical protein